ncbi:serine hydroxymethyltransferase [Blochmannia endosymbiont of Polyrhachis (Hedomyrma) turneri]|uniref:serine hydroxymethyltransferase n=1 Tax=Blochmannia endosymbiont of Polyrhachis (Hedomyrma) turneri TaxID=1505596 RepID=UPI00061A7E74|nr:serine hydroxymethyltransferase [Blochmannia endosymbiont of Polyrhachis (Hedomyrma) turneri]AKC60097.1 serine hydroxymethyltransferase [Blochmannia endosymbiont of Polyrhachis (Hedomyrma) turneri]
MLKSIEKIDTYDPELWEAMQRERVRQEEHLELIASENYVTTRVLEAQGSQLTNKYAEGYTGKRYYGGCEYVDVIEQLSINRAKSLFGAEYVNVQPHSGSQANFAVYNALLNPGDVILGMDLMHGGHLTHGSSVNFSGKLYRSVFYGVDNNGHIDYERLFDLSKMYRPKMIIGGFSSYSGICDWQEMRRISDNVGAYLLVDMAHVAGLVVADIYPNPLPYAHVVTTTTHKTLAGPRGGLILSSCGDERLYKKIDSSVFPGSQGGPLMHVIAAKAIALREAMSDEFKVYQHQIVKNSQAMVKVFLFRNFKVVSGCTSNHLFLLDLMNKNLTGRAAESILGEINIIVNKNVIPNDCHPPYITSGVRIGTAAVTRRGLGIHDVSNVADWICDMLENINDKDCMHVIKKHVLNICERYPVYI